MGWLWVDSRGTHGKPTFRRLTNPSWLSEICNHFGDMAAWSQKSLKTVAQKLPFWKKIPLRGKFSKLFSERIYHLSDPRLVCKFREIWLTGSRQSRALFTSQKVKFRLAVPLSLLRGSRPKSVRASSRQYTRSAPNFIRMRTLRSELYIAVVNIVETRVTKCFQYSAMLRRVLTAIAWLGLTVSPRLLFICLSTISGRRHWSLGKGAEKSNQNYTSIKNLICLTVKDWKLARYQPFRVVNTWNSLPNGLCLLALTRSKQDWINSGTTRILHIISGHICKEPEG